MRQNLCHGDISDVNNYCVIALANVETKILIAVVLAKVQTSNRCDNFQLGLKSAFYCYVHICSQTNH